MERLPTQQRVSSMEATFWLTSIDFPSACWPSAFFRTGQDRVAVGWAECRALVNSTQDVWVRLSFCALADWVTHGCSVPLPIRRSVAPIDDDHLWLL